MLSSWINALTVAGGVALLLFAVRYLRKGLDRLFGPRLGPWMQRLGRSPTRVFATGLGVSVLAPSSTTMSLLAVQSVQAGHLSARQMLVAMLGANVGLTVTVQLIALRVEQYAPILILLGVILFQFTSRSLTRGIGQVMLGVGFLLLAVGIMKETIAGSGLGASDDFGSLIEIAARYPVMLCAAGIVLAMLLQSATATIGLLIGIAAAGEISLSILAATVLGANVGMALTTLVVGWRHVDARRLAMGNLLVKLLVAILGLVTLAFIGPRLAPPGPEMAPIWIAQTHTGFNVVVALIGLPLVGRITSLTEYLVPAPPEREREFGPKFITDGPIVGVAIALGQSLREIMHLSEIVRSMLRDVWIALEESDERLARVVSERDDEVDLLDNRIKRFLTRLSKEDREDLDADEQMKQLRYLSELETIGDVIDKNLSELVLKKIRLRASFSGEGADELNEFYRRVLENFEIADTAFTTRDRTLAEQLIRNKERLNRYENDLRDRHFERLKEGLSESHETSAIHLDLLTHLRRINSCLAHVGYAIIQAEDG